MDFPRDFEAVQEYRARVARESLFDEPATVETDIGKVLEEPPSPFIVDVGPHTSRRDREAIQAEQDRWTRLERMGR